MEFLTNKKHSIPIIILFVFFMFFKPVVCFIILGLLVLFLSSYYYIFFTDIYKNGIECTGKIVFYEPDSDGHKTPVVEFLDKDGNKIQKKPYYYASTDLSIVRTYENNIDKPITILYDRKNSEKFVIGKERNFSFFSLIFMALIGVLFFTIGICGLLGSIKINF